MHSLDKNLAFEKLGTIFESDSVGLKALGDEVRKVKRDDEESESFNEPEQRAASSEKSHFVIVEESQSEFVTEGPEGSRIRTRNTTVFASQRGRGRRYTKTKTKTTCRGKLTDVFANADEVLTIPPQFTARHCNCFTSKFPTAKKRIPSTMQVAPPNKLLKEAYI